MTVTPPTSRGGSSSAFDPSTSWLEAATASPTPVAADGTVYEIEWGTLTGSAGSDIAIDAVDNTKINILTSGVYYAILGCAPTLSGAVNGGTFECFSNETFDLLGGGHFAIPFLLGAQFDIVTHSEPRAIVAPYVMRFGSDLTSDGATPIWTPSARLWIQRIF